MSDATDEIAAAARLATDARREATKRVESATRTLCATVVGALRRLDPADRERVIFAINQKFCAACGEVRNGGGYCPRCE